MSPSNHFIASWLVAALTTDNPRDRKLVTLAGVLPDLDGLGIVVDIAGGLVSGHETNYDFYQRYHHFLSHGWPGAVVIAGALACFGRRHWRVWWLSLLTFHLHLLCDLVGSRGPDPGDLWPIAYGEPLFRNPTFLWHGQWRLDGSENMVFFVIVFVAALWVSTRIGSSFLEFFGQRMDSTFVGILRRGSAGQNRANLASIPGQLVRYKTFEKIYGKNFPYWHFDGSILAATGLQSCGAGGLILFDNQSYNSMQHYPKHYCGVFGIFGHPNAAQLTYYGLYALQHRGQESAGIVTSDGKRFYEHRGMGLVSQIFKGDVLDSLIGPMAVGHTRYSTTGSSHIRNAQPLTGNCRLGHIAIAHNGNLTNAVQVRDELEAQGLMFQTTVDSEIILNLLAQPTLDGQENNLVSTVRRIEGAYSLAIMTERELIGVRDPYGFRPLSIGKVDGAWVLASETCAFDLIHAEFVRDVEPGEIVIIDKNGLRSIQAFPEHERRAFCIFEYVYFARPDSTIANRNVYKVRVEMGRQLAREHPVKADLVIPVPDSGNCAALGYSLESGIPYEMAFVRNHYVGRSFLQPSQLIRDFDVRVKLNLIHDLVKGKRVIVVDDSIVRGTTSKTRVNSLKEAGATEVHVMVSCPPHMNPCVYGIDFPDRSKLMAANHSLEEIRQYLNADSVSYLSQAGMVKATGLPKSNFCMACYDGDYPVQYDPLTDKHIMERRRSETFGLGEELAREELQAKLL